MNTYFYDRCTKVQNEDSYVHTFICEFIRVVLNVYLLVPILKQKKVFRRQNTCDFTVLSVLIISAKTIATIACYRAISYIH